MAKTALIWGANGGIGRALVSSLVAQGWQVLAAGRDTDQLEGLTEHVFDVEFLEAGSLQGAISGMSQVVEEIQLWVYAAGDITSQAVGEMSLPTWRRILDANLSGAFLATQASLPLLAKDAHLFYLGAIHERLRLPGLSAYAAAKAGLEALAEVVRKETRRKVSVLRPAAVDTAFWSKVPFRLPPHHLKPDDVAARLLQAYQKGETGVLDLS
ncbi:MAG: SDR family NAD(P)-dependent oxidoreductase [Anaerolineales bacterium]|jgi:NAD(P)-dependent dehydrogenase (short-subunit alcohol dehydrogenase family)|nr:SDR family NAD(P)-dependent oxidoreductase [Anaerolineales bacterium]